MVRYYRNFAFSFLILAGACTVNPSVQSTRFGQMPSSDLWTIQSTTQSPIILLLVEAELGTRGQYSNGSRYIGRKTASNIGQSLYPRSATSNDTLNCSDFKNSAEAQKYFLTHGGPMNDSNNLDADGDGMACEWGTQVRRIVSSQRPIIATPRRTYSSSRCYTGPRGGRYTISASGRRNYGGC